MFGLLKRIVAPLAAVALGIVASTAASAATVPIVGFTPFNSSLGPVIVLDGSGNLTTGAGATSLVVAVSNPPLSAASGTTVTIPGSLTLSGFAESGLATMMGSDIVQNLTTGRFNLFDASSNLLLTGSVNSAQIVTNSVTGSVLSGKFNYDGGSLFAAFPAAGLFNPGEFSFTLTAITPPPTISGDGTLSAFSASATGNFSAETVPLPATAWMGLVLIGGFGGARGVSMLRRRSALLAA
jgi:hypothetical protein